MNNSLRITAVVIAVIIAITALPFNCYSLTSGDYEYTVKDDQTVAITDYTGSATDLTIPEQLDGYTVTELKSAVFYQNKSLKTLVIPETVTTVGFMAFWGCSALVSISFPSSVESIPNGPFVGCSKLKTISVASDNEYYCSYDGCLYSKDMTRLIAYPMAKTNTSYTLPDGVTTLANTCMGGNPYLRSVVLPYGLETIGSQAFGDCKNLVSVTVPETVTTISSSAFSSSNSFTTICGVVGSYAETFANEKGYNFISTSTLTSEFSYIMLPDNTLKIIGYSGNAQRVVIPQAIGNFTVSVIAAGAFSTNISVTEAQIPSCVNNIEQGAFSDAFETVYGYRNTEAQSFALTYGYTFVALDSSAGDVNFDGLTDLEDYNMVLGHICGECDLCSAQFSNENDTVIQFGTDIEITVTQSYIAADVDGDGAVDAFDLFIIGKLINGLQ